jgi:hypothetical protein
MTSKEVEVLLCFRCKKEPVFFPWPNAEFPVLYVALCECNRSMYAINAALNRHLYRNKDKQITRKASLRRAIRGWNTSIHQILKVRSSASGVVSATCKYCKREDLMWGKRPYKSAWNSKLFDFILYERKEVPAEDASDPLNPLSGHKINKIKFKIHNCLSTKNIVSVTYTKA